MRQVQPRAWHIAHDIGEHRQVAGHGGLLGRGRPAAQPEHGRHEPVVRFRALGQRRVLGMVDDRQPEHARVGECVAQDRRRAHRRPVVREPDDARVGQLAKRREGLPARPTVTAP